MRPGRRRQRPVEHRPFEAIDHGPHGVPRGAPAPRAVAAGSDKTVAAGQQAPPEDPFDEPRAEREQVVAHQVVRLRLLADRDRPAGRRVWALPQRPVDLGDPAAPFGASPDVGDGAQQGHLVRGVEAHLPVLGRAPPVHVEQARDDVEAQLRQAAVDQGHGRLELEVDHRRAHHLDTAAAAQDLRRLEVELDVLLVGPDAPLAAVDGLAHLEVPPVGRETFGDLGHGLAPARPVAHQLAVLRNREGELVAGGLQCRGEPQLVVVRGLPRVQPQHHRTHAQLGNLPQLALEVLRPRPDGEADTRERHRLRAARCPQLVVAAPHRRRRRHNHRQIAEVRGAVGEPDRPLLEPAGVLVRLVRKVVPHRLVAGRGAQGGGRNVRVVRAAVRVAAAEAEAPQPVLERVLEDVGANRGRVEPPAEVPARRRLAPVAAEEGGAVLGPDHRQPADVPGPAVGTQAPAGPGAVEIDQVQLETVVSGAGYREDVAHREVAVEDPGVVDAPGEASEPGQKGHRVDVGEVLPSRFAGQAPEEVAHLDRAAHPLGDEVGRPVRRLRLHPHQRPRGRQADPQQLLGHPPAARRLASP